MERKGIIILLTTIGLVILISIILVVVFVVRKDSYTTRIDPETSSAARNKYKTNNMVLIFSNEMKDMNRIQEDFVFEDQPAGTLGTGAQNYVGSTGCRITSNGLYMPVTHNSPLKKDPNGNYIFDPKQWDAIKMTGRKKVRFQYGTIEATVRCPKLTGTWPAFWLNFCNGTYGPNKDGKMVLGPYQEDWPYPCPMFWPPEIDIMERYSAYLATFKSPDDIVKKVPGLKASDVMGGYDQNMSSVHSPNQVQSGPFDISPTQWCPQGDCNGAPPKPGASTPKNKCVPRKAGSGYCFGTSVYGRDTANPCDEFITYRLDWDSNGCKFYMNDLYYGVIDYRSLAMYQQGAVSSINIPTVPMFPIFNTSILPGQVIGAGSPLLGIVSALNFENGKFREDGMEISSVRVYQNKDTATGLNPPMTDEIKRTIFTNKRPVNTFSQACNYPSALFGGPNPPQNITGALQGIINTTCNRLSNVYKDNYCLGMDAAMISNHAGYFALSGTPTADALGATAGGVLSYMSDTYGECCADGTCKPMGYEVAPKELTQSDAFKKYGWPLKDVSPKAPCYGVQTVTGYDTSDFKCV